MNAINEQREVANEIAEAISNPLNAGIQIDEVRNPWRERACVLESLLYACFTLGGAQGRAGGARAG